MTDLKVFKGFFLGIKVIQYNSTITLYQSACIKTILNKFNMSDCNPISAPLESKLNYEVFEANDSYNVKTLLVV